MPDASPSSLDAEAPAAAYAPSARSPSNAWVIDVHFCFVLFFIFVLFVFTSGRVYPVVSFILHRRSGDRCRPFNESNDLSCFFFFMAFYRFLCAFLHQHDADQLFITMRRIIGNRDFVVAQRVFFFIFSNYPPL